MEYEKNFYEFEKEDYEEFTCDADNCGQVATLLVSHDTRHKKTPPIATFRGNMVCESHLKEAIDELIKDYGAPNGDNIKITVTDLIPPKE